MPLLHPLASPLPLRNSLFFFFSFLVFSFEEISSRYNLHGEGGGLHLVLSQTEHLLLDSASSLVETSHLFHSPPRPPYHLGFIMCSIRKALLTWKPMERLYSMDLSPSGPSPPISAITLQRPCASGPRHPDNSIAKKLSFRIHVPQICAILCSANSATAPGCNAEVGSPCSNLMLM
jgi:hypothetical protein